MDGHILPERLLFCDCGVVNPTDVLDFVIDNRTQKRMNNDSKGVTKV